jgi:hypothetical protein
MRRYILCALLGFTIVLAAPRINAQVFDPGLSFDELIKGGGEDMSTYMGYYVEPFVNAFGTGIANGWYNTAAPHETLGFDLTVYGSFVSVPDEELFFTFLESDYNNLSLFSGGSADLPTMLGGETTVELVSTYTDSQSGQTVTSAPFAAPNGFGEDLPTNYVPVPMLQLGIGIPKNTELIVRYAPVVSNNDLDLTFFGIGLKHDIKQWIPGIRTLPFDLSVLVGYTNLDMKVFLNSSDVIQGSDNREGIFDVTALTFQALVSKKVSVLTVYGGIGYNSVKSNFAMKGDYTIPTDVPGVGFGVSDPVNLDYTLNGIRATVGLRVKLAVFTLHTDYTIQEYNTITCGLGISVR